LQQGLDRQPMFRDAADHQAFLGWLREAARQFKVAVHAYTLLPDRIDLLLTPIDTTGLGRLMQWVGRHYVPYFNRKYSRAGTLWQGRFKATVVDAERYFMACSRYVELQPVAAALVPAAVDYPWSSAVHHAGIKSDPLITDHQTYWALGNTPFEREASYRVLLEQALTVPETQSISAAVSKGWALGDERFLGQLERVVERRLAPARRGRPAKAPA
jgi:putative transposase